MHDKLRDKNYFREYHQRNKRRRWGQMMERRYGITLQQFEHMLIAQAGRCEVCGEPFGKMETGMQRLAVDHCHEIGRVRGLLHTSCNTLLGLAKDSPALLLKAASYLAKFS